MVKVNALGRAPVRSRIYRVIEASAMVLQGLLHCLYKDSIRVR